MIVSFSFKISLAPYEVVTFLWSVKLACDQNVLFPCFPASKPIFPS